MVNSMSEWAVEVAEARVKAWEAREEYRLALAVMMEADLARYDLDLRAAGVMDAAGPEAVDWEDKAAARTVYFDAAAEVERRRTLLNLAIDNLAGAVAEAGGGWE